MEEWRLIDGFNGCYEISNLGNIRSIERLVLRTDPKNANKKRLFKYKSQTIVPFLTKKGYLRVRLRYNMMGKGEQVHRLVAKAFIPNPENKEQVNHINGIKTDNRVENLEWVTNYENWLHSVKIGKQNNSTKGRPRDLSKYL